MNRPTTPSQGSRPSWLPEGPCADLVAGRDWSGTPLGPLSAWPRSLRTVLGTALRARAPMTLLWGPTGVLLYNDAMAQVMGDHHPRAFGRPAEDALPPFRDLNARVLAAARAGETLSLRGQLAEFPQGGVPRRGWFDVDYIPVLGDDDRPAGALATVLDVTDRILAEQGREEGEARLRALADNLAGAVVYQLETSRDLSERRYTYVSAAVEAVLGIPLADALSEPLAWVSSVDPGDLDRLATAEREAAQALSTLDVEVRSRRPDGRWITAHITSRPRLSADGGMVWDGLLLDVTAQRAAEAEHRRTASLLAAIGASTPDLIYAKDAESRFLYANPAVAELIGRPAEALVGAPVESWAADLEEVESIRLNDLQIMESGQPAEFEETFTGGDGTTRIYRTVKSPLRDGDGRVIGLVGLSGDVTEALSAREELRRLNATLEERVADALAERKLWADVIDATDAFISVVGPDLRLRAINAASLREAQRLTGRAPRVGDHVADVDDPEIAAAAVALWTRAIAGDPFSITAEFGSEGSGRRSYEMRFQPLLDADGRPAGALQFGIDVTDRLRDQARAEAAEAARRGADALYRAYFENSGEALFVVGVLPAGGFTFEQVNPAHRAALGFDIASDPGRRIEEVLPPEVAAGVAANYRRVVETGQLQRYRESGEIGGRTIHAETVLVPVRDEEGRIVRIVGSSRDMTAQVQAEEALRQTQKLESMGRLTGGVAHDFNNLLTPIIASLDMLQRRGAGDERMRRLVDGALQSAERARVLVQRLLAFARRQPLQPVAVDLGLLTEGMVDLVASTVGPRIRVETAVEAGLPPVTADANQLEMAILNLAVNARDAMPDGGRLRIEAATTGERPSTLPDGSGFARLTVVDTGIGMDEATLRRAVEPFFSTKGVGRGTGLGLSMVHGLASQLGGALELRSRPGEGTEVTLWLPVAAAAAATEDRAPGLSPAGAEGRVLLVDDEELVRAATAQMLADLGYEVEEAPSVEVALRRLEAGPPPDLVVTDHLMPGMTGTELARALKARAGSPPVLLISGYADDAGLPPDLPRLTKPFRQAELAAALAALGRPTA